MNAHEKLRNLWIPVQITQSYHFLLSRILPYHALFIGSLLWAARILRRLKNPQEFDNYEGPRRG